MFVTLSQTPAFSAGYLELCGQSDTGGMFAPALPTGWPLVGVLFEWRTSGGWKPGGSGRTAQTAACAGSGNGAVSPLACAGCLGVWVPAGGSPCSRGCGRGRGVQSHLCVGFAPMCLLPRSARVSDPQHVAGEPRGLQVGAPCCPPLPGLRTPRQPPDGHVSPPLPGENS